MSGTSSSEAISGLWHTSRRCSTKIRRTSKMALGVEWIIEWDEETTTSLSTSSIWALSTVTTPSESGALLWNHFDFSKIPMMLW